MRTIEFSHSVVSLLDVLECFPGGHVHHEMLGRNKPSLKK